MNALLYAIYLRDMKELALEKRVYLQATDQKALRVNGSLPSLRKLKIHDMKDEDSEMLYHKVHALASGLKHAGVMEEEIVKRLKS